MNIRIIASNLAGQLVDLPDIRVRNGRIGRVTTTGHVYLQVSADGEEEPMLNAHLD